MNRGRTRRNTFYDAHKADHRAYVSEEGALIACCHAVDAIERDSCVSTSVTVYWTQRQIEAVSIYSFYSTLHIFRFHHCCRISLGSSSWYA